MMTPAAPAPPSTPLLLSAQDLGHGYPGRALFSRLSFHIRPGLTLVQGGDGRGKSTLLRILGGQLQPQQGRVLLHAGTLFDGLLAPGDADQPTVAQAWLVQQQAQHAGWQPEQAAGLAQAFGLQDHLHKPLYMLSTGSRRKLGLVAAAASGALLTLIDSPFAALDAGSCRVLSGLLAQAAAGRSRAWVMADSAPPPGVPRAQLAAVVDLGD